MHVPHTRRWLALSHSLQPDFAAAELRALLETQRRMAALTSILTARSPPSTWRARPARAELAPSCSPRGCACAPLAQPAEQEVDRSPLAAGTGAFGPASDPFEFESAHAIPIATDPRESFGRCSTFEPLLSLLSSSPPP